MPFRTISLPSVYSIDLVVGGPVVTLDVTVSGAITIDDSDAVVASVTVLPSSISLFGGSSQQFIAQARNSTGGLIPDAVIDWTSTDDSVAPVDGSGMVVAVGVGAATIRATSDGFFDEADITVSEAFMPTGLLSQDLARQLIREARYGDLPTSGISGSLGGGGGNALTGTRGSAVVAGSGVGALSYVVPLGWCFLTRRIHLDADQPGLYALQLGGTQYNRGAYYKYIGAAGGGEFDLDFPEYAEPIYDNDAISATVYVTGTVRPFGSAFFDGILVTSDFAYDADHTICIFGDSILGFSSPNNDMRSRLDMVGFQLMSKLRTDGASVRHVNKSFGGSQSNQQRQLVSSGYLDFPFDLMVWSTGHNDPGASITVPTYQQNMRDIIAGTRYSNPECGIIICAFPGTTGGDPGGFRAAAQAVAAEYASDPKIVFLDLSDATTGAWTDAQQATYTQDGSHANKAGMGRMATAIQTKIHSMAMTASWFTP